MKKIYLSELMTGIKEELEHKDVTGGDLLATAKIAIAHLREDSHYYTKLKKAGLIQNPSKKRLPKSIAKESWQMTKTKDYAIEEVAKQPLKFNRGDLAGIIGSTSRVVSQDGITRYIYAPTTRGLQVFKNIKSLAPVETRYWEISKSGGRVKVTEYTKPSPMRNEWEIPVDLYINQARQELPTADAGSIAKFHKLKVQQALSEGKPVPAEVLKDYPDLAKAIPKVPVPPEVTEPLPQKALQEIKQLLDTGKLTFTHAIDQVTEKYGVMPTSGLQNWVLNRLKALSKAPVTSKVASKRSDKIGHLTKQNIKRLRKTQDKIVKILNKRGFIDSSVLGNLVDEHGNKLTFGDIKKYVYPQYEIPFKEFLETYKTNPIEGYWQEGKSKRYPMPKENSKSWKGESDFVNKLKRLQRKSNYESYMGYSWCRICNRKNKSGEYTWYKYTKDGYRYSDQRYEWRWPEGYLHYIEKHHVKPTRSFYSWVMKKYREEFE